MCPLSKKAKFPGWRTMTGAQRRNAKMDDIFERAKAEGRGLISKRVTVTLERPGERIEVINRFWTVQEAEDFLATSATIDPDYLDAGYYGVNAPEEMVNMTATLTPTWEGPPSSVKGWLDRTGGIRIRHTDGTETYIQPGEFASDLTRTLNACLADSKMSEAARQANIGVLLCDQLEGL